MAGIYLHIPFCKKRCIYCDFYSTTFGKEIRERYVEALVHELILRKCEVFNDTINTIYFGGGTPSLLSINEIGYLLSTIQKHYRVSQEAETTLEANPDDITHTFSRDLIKLGVNRISLGIQTFSSELLTFLNRRHTSAQAENAVNVLHENGFNNISIDLIYGLPHQTLHQWTQDVTYALSLPITHLSSYALSYEPGTKMKQLLQKGEITPQSDETLVQMYHILNELTTQKGFCRYEISNFSLPNYYSRHNTSYWNFTPYIGVGCGAHSYDGKSTRRANLPNIKKYIESVSKKEDAPHSVECLNQTERLEEYIMLSLRTAQGFSLKHIQTHCSPRTLQVLYRKMHTHQNQGHATLTRDEYFCLTTAGIMIADYIISDLLSTLD